MHQKKRHPRGAGLRLPCASRSDGEAGNSPLRGSDNRPLDPFQPAMLGCSEGDIRC